MRRVALAGTEIHVSRVSFGTASLHHLPTSRRRQDLLAAAFDRGFTHFDAAPVYGFGIAEQELGRIPRSRRDKLTIATKIGLYAPGGSGSSTASVWIRKAAGKLSPAFSRPIVNWSIAAAAKSLESSLRRLRTDQIDLLLLHEPVSPAIQSDAFLEWLAQEQSKGTIRAWGLAGQSDSMETWLSSNHPLGMVLQVRDSLDRREADHVSRHGRDLQITYGYLSAPPSSSGLVSATAILARALVRNATGSILVSTRQLARISELAAVAERYDGDDN